MFVFYRNICGRDWNCTETFAVDGLEKSLKKDPSTTSCCAQVVTGKETEIYYLLHTAEYATAILASDWLCFSRHKINIYVFLVYGKDSKLSDDAGRELSHGFCS